MTEKEERWGYVQENHAFIDSILSGEPAPVTALDGLKSVNWLNPYTARYAKGNECRSSDVLDHYDQVPKLRTYKSR